MQASDKVGEWRSVFAHVFSHEDARYRPRFQIRELLRIVPALNVILQRDIEQDAVYMSSLDLALVPGVSMLNWVDPGTHLVIKVLLKYCGGRILVDANIGIARGTRTSPVILRDHIAAGCFDQEMQRGIFQRHPFDQMCDR